MLTVTIIPIGKNIGPGYLPTDYYEEGRELLTESRRAVHDARRRGRLQTALRPGKQAAAIVSFSGVGSACHA